jgi:hypothetical protein
VFLQGAYNLGVKELQKDFENHLFLSNDCIYKSSVLISKFRPSDSNPLHAALQSNSLRLLRQQAGLLCFLLKDQAVLLQREAKLASSSSAAVVAIEAKNSIRDQDGTIMNKKKKVGGNNASSMATLQRSKKRAKKEDDEFEDCLLSISDDDDEFDEFETDDNITVAVEKPRHVTKNNNNSKGKRSLQDKLGVFTTSLVG